MLLSSLLDCLEENRSDPLNGRTRSTAILCVRGYIDEALLMPEGDGFVPPDQKTPGAGGLRRFFFRAKSEGSTTLTLINKRAWQRDDQAIDTFKLRIRILT